MTKQKNDGTDIDKKNTMSVSLSNLYINVNKGTVSALGEPSHLDYKINEDENMFYVFGSDKGIAVRNGRANIIRKNLQDFVEKTVVYYYRDNTMPRRYKIFGEPVFDGDKVVSVGFDLNKALKLK